MVVIQEEHTCVNFNDPDDIDINLYHTWVLESAMIDCVEDDKKFRLVYFLPDNASAEQAEKIAEIIEDALNNCAKVLGGRILARIP